MEKTLPDLNKALANHPQAKALWNNLTSIARRDFVSWIAGAKQADTRKRRVARACDMLAKGKRRPCCYSIVPMDLYKAIGAHAQAKIGWKKLTADGKRDFVDWLESEKNSQARKQRIEKALTLLSAGKRPL
jgi:uncharacterized protein YdeI (YjbR/CyaY-like superfamily)